jgi:hypothetical protein
MTTKSRVLIDMEDIKAIDQIGQTLESYRLILARKKIPPELSDEAIECLKTSIHHSMSLRKKFMKHLGVSEITY